MAPPVLSNDQLISQLQHQIEMRSYDRQFYEWAISQCRTRKLFDELDTYRKALASRFILRPGEFMEWLADNRVYEENLSNQRLATLVQACSDIFNAQIWVNLLNVVANSPQLSFEEKCKCFQKGCVTAGKRIDTGHLVWRCYLDFLDTQDDANDELIEATFDRFVRTPFLDMANMAQQLADEYDWDDESMALALKMSNECVETEALLANPSFETQLQGIHKLMENHRDDEDFILAQYRRVLLSQQLHEPRPWLEFVFYIRFDDMLDLQDVHWALKVNPSCVELWTELFLAAEGERSLSDLDTMFLESLKAIEHFYGRDSASELALVQDYVGVLWRRSANAERFHDLVITLLESRNGRRNLITGLHLLCARFLYHHGHIKLGRQVLDNFIASNDQEEAAWREYAELEAIYEKGRAHNVYVDALKTLKTPSPALAQSWLAFERISGGRAEVCSARCMIFDRWGPQCLSVSAAAPRPTHTESSSLPSKRLKTETIEVAPIEIDIAPKKEVTVFVNNIDFKVDEAQLKSLFEEHAGPVHKVHLGRKESGESRGFAHIEFHSEACAQKALELDRTRLNGRPLFISPYQAVGSKDWTSPVPAHSQSRDPRVLYVSHLPAKTTEETLISVFAKYPGLESVRLGLAKSGACKGFAYVQFASEQDAVNALCEDGGMLLGQEISVLISDPSLAPKKQKQKTAMVPVALTRGKPKSRLETASAAASQETIAPQDGNSKSNSDFRKLLGL